MEFDNNIMSKDSEMFLQPVDNNISCLANTMTSVWSLLL